MLLPNGRPTILVAADIVYIKSKKAQKQMIPRFPIDKFGNVIGCEFKCVAETETPRLRRKYERKIVK